MARTFAFAAAKQALITLHRELMDLNPSAARSLGEGMEETLTVHRLHLPMQLRKTLASTSVIESAFSIVGQVCTNLKRWYGGGPARALGRVRASGVKQSSPFSVDLHGSARCLLGSKERCTMSTLSHF